MVHIVPREAPPRRQWQLEQQGIHPLLARLYASRGVTDKSELDYGLNQLLPPAALTNATEAAILLADAIEAGARILIVADYDCDGATACAVGVRALRMLSAGSDARIDFLVPNRFTTGYGLSPEVVELAAAFEPDLLVTVDNGIASIEGVAAAQARGIATLITDHHLPGDELPAADCIVNPNQHGCDFPSKNLAGVGVMFYVMLALRAELRERGAFTGGKEPNLAELLDLVALGTVADVVKLDHNNRILVAQGIKRIRAGKLHPGLRALFRVAGRDPAQASSFDLGFTLGPRLNAAGRLADMKLGVECLLCDDPVQALNIAQELDNMNRARRDIEAEMQEQAMRLLERIDTDGDGNSSAAGLALFDPDWHQGVIGILASRIKDRLHRPVFALARGDEGIVKGSGRSIPGLHLRDALDLVAKRAPGVLLRFGGHAAAAGVTLREEELPRFQSVFADVAAELLTPADLTRTLASDGPLETSNHTLDVARLLENEVWGQGFPGPVFDDTFSVVNSRVLKDKHLKLQLRKDRATFDAIRFNNTELPGDPLRAAYRLSINSFNGVESVQLMIDALIGV